MKKVQLILEKKYYFLLALPLLFILQAYNELFGYLTFKVTAIALVITAAATTFLYFILKKSYKNNKTAAVLTFFLMLFLVTFGALHDFLKEFTTLSFLSKYSLLIPFFLLLFGFVFLTLRHRSYTYNKTYRFLNVLILLLLVIETSIFIYNVLKPSVLIDNRMTAFAQFRKTKAISNKPDIFFLVFDAMPSSKAMLNEWNFDNSHLDSFLAKEGFYIAADAKSNYNLTMLSVTSTLNMEYLLPTQIFTGGEIQMIEKASPALLKNSTTEILKNEGYQISQFQPLSVKNKDWRGRLYFESLVTGHYWLKTFPGRVYNDLRWHLGNIKSLKERQRAIAKKNQFAHKENLLYTLEKIKESCSAASTPKFVYGHFMLPHGPYIFDSSGQMLIQTKSFSKKEKEETLFMNQVKYVDKLIIDLVLFIKKNNKPNTIIIIEGDHGFRNIFGKHYMTFDNLNAIYFPDGDYRQFNQSQSPINTFRNVFNKYFGANLQLLKDSSIFVPYDLQPEK